MTDPRQVVSAPNSEARPIPIEDLYFSQSFGNRSWSPDGKEIAFTTDLSGRPNLWKVSSTGGWPVQLVQSNESQSDGAWSPDGRWIVYAQDAGGNELSDIFLVPGNGGAVVNLTQTPDINEESPLWSPDGKTLALTYKPKEASVSDIALMDMANHRVRKLTDEASADFNWSAVAWSADAQTIYANRYQSDFADADIYAINVATRDTTRLTDHQGKVLNLASSLSPDGKLLLLTSNENGGYENVAILNLATHKKIWITRTKWEAQSAHFSPKGDYLTYTLNADGRKEAYLVSLPSLRTQKLPFAPGITDFAGYPSTFSPSGDRLLLSHESSMTPQDFWTYDIARRSIRQISRSSVASLSASPVPASEVVHYKAKDGRLISALLWVPFNLRRDASNPAVVVPHGGPTSQMQDEWNPIIAALVSRGYVCIAPNVRGSTGYGMEFQRANFQDLGGGDLQDEVSAATFLVETGYVNSKRIGITGGSYGGYMTLMAVSRTPDVWAAGVEEYGIVNWLTMLEHEDPFLQQYEKSLLGDPVKDRAAYDAASPITYLHDTHAPLLILQGDNDPRVPKEEALQVFDLLRQDGKTVEAHFYPNEGHGFAQRDNRIDALSRMVAWFDRYLKN